MNSLPPPRTSLQFSFFDQIVRLAADSADFFEPFARLYPRFLHTASSPLLPVTLDVAAYTSSDNPWRRPVLVLDGQIWPFRDLWRLQGFVLEQIVYAVATRVRSHILLHAGVLARQGRAVVLAGDSRHGKTTLTLALLKRGFGFLSDELAALERGSGIVSPFPRSLRIRPGTLERAGISLEPASLEKWLDKYILDIDQIWRGALVGPVPLGHLILLQNPAEKKDNTMTTPGLSLLVEQASADLVQALRRLDGIEHVEVETGEGGDTIYIQARAGSTAVDRVVACCEAHGVLPLDVLTREASVPSFSGPARLEPIRPSEMAFELVRHFQGSHQSALLQQEHKDNAVGLYLELLTWVQAAHCHRLYVGPLEEMVDLVHALADSTL